MDGLFEALKAKGVVSIGRRTTKPWELSMTAFDPDGYAVEFAHG